MSAARNLIYDVWMTSSEITRRNGIRASQVAWIAIPRGPLDPVVAPENASRKVATVVAETKADAIEQAKWTLNPKYQMKS